MLETTPKPPECKDCPLYKLGGRKISPTIPKEQPTLIIVGEAPGFTEDREGVPFVGPAGKMLYKICRGAGIKLSSALITNCILCRPPNNYLDPAWRDKALKICFNNFLKPIITDPRYSKLPILALGGTASEVLAGESTISEAAGYFYEIYDHPVIPLWHPAYLLRQRIRIPAAIKIARKVFDPYPRDEAPEKIHINPHPEKLIEILESEPWEFIVLDTETVGFNDLTMTAFGFALPNGEAYSFSNNPGYQPVIQKICELPTIKVAHNIVFDAKVLEHAGYTLEGTWHDTTRIAHFFGETFTHKLEYLAGVHLKLRPWKQLAKQEGLLTYNAKDCQRTALLYQKFKKEMPAKSWRLFQRTEDLEKVLFEMWKNGFLVDVLKLEEIKKTLTTQLRAWLAAWQGIAGDIRPAERKRTIQLFQSLGAKLGRTKKGSPKLDADILKTLIARGGEAGQAAEILLNIRKIEKVLSTYTELPLHSDGRIHPNFNSTGTVSGRLSSQNPNMQNFPKRDSAQGQIRSCFVPAPGYVLVEADFSQAETRVTAILAKEEAMLQAWEEKRDIHTFTASKIFGIPEEEVTKAQRHQAKTVVYAMSYGAQAARIAKTAEIPKQHAARIIQGFKRAFPNYTGILEEWTNQATGMGYLVNPFGRVFTFLTERIVTQAKNFIPQSTVADIVNICMCDFYKMIKKHSLPIRLLLQIHDSIVFEVEESFPIEEVIALTKDIMERPWPELDNHVIPVSVGVGHDWSKL